MCDQSNRILNHPILGETRTTDASFWFEDKEIPCVEGEPIAAALFAAGILLTGHSEIGRPRGVVCGIGRCASCKVVVDGVLNVRACSTAVKQGMRVYRQTGRGQNHEK